MIPTEVIEKCQTLGLRPGAIAQYADYLSRHVHYVQEFGSVFGVDSRLLSVHDESKWSLEEFPAFCMELFGGGGNDQELALAWLHHENSNPHHWGHWIARTGTHSGQPLPMPEVYVREMVADWHGMGKVQAGENDIAAWINRNGPAMVLHDDTVTLIHEIMKDAGYACIDNYLWSFVQTERLRKV